MSIRAFVALTVPANISNYLGDCAAQLSSQDKSNAVRWVTQDNYHITMAFLGDQNESDLEFLAEKIEEKIQYMPIPLSINEISPFPFGKPKLIAAMIEQTEELLQIQKDVVSSIYEIGLNIEKRNFKPHITLGRFRHSKNKFDGIISSIKSNKEHQGDANELCIYESQLMSYGAEYEALVRFPLDEFNFEEE